MDENNIDVQAVCDVATVVSRSIASLASDGADLPLVSADCTTVAALFQCFTLRLDCDLVRQLYQDLEIGGTLPPPTSYVSVYRSSSDTGTFVRDWIRNATAATRLPVGCETSENCTSSAPVCLQSECIGDYYTFYHDALSPAFGYSSDSRQYGIVDNSPFLPQWTEAYWMSPYLTLFVMDNPLLAPLSLIVGVLELLICIVAAIMGKKYLHQHLKSL
mmetsp:Transcript_19504/g.74846  ORF Transcript_19504/g.74846 Transcript_19504/m.74846 type:complete len:217 (+) Transcript_19504:15-665(+)